MNHRGHSGTEKCVFGVLHEQTKGLIQRASSVLSGSLSKTFGLLCVLSIKTKFSLC